MTLFVVRCSVWAITAYVLVVGCMLCTVVAASVASNADSLLFTGGLRSVLDSSSSTIDDASLQQILIGAQQHQQTDAMYVLAMLKFYGQRVDQDVAGAIRLLKVLAEQRKHRDAAFALGVLYASGTEVSTQDDRQSAAWFSSSANWGHTDAKWMLATLYNEGRGVGYDPQRALELLVDSATKDQNPHAMFHLGVMYEYGQAATRDTRKAAMLYTEASEGNVVDATYYLALLHASGRGVPKSTSEALRLLKKAADRGFPPALHRLGAMYADGVNGVAVDYTVALHFFKQATAANDRRVSSAAAHRVKELEMVLAQAEALVREQERELGIPLRVQVASIEGF